MPRHLVRYERLPAALMSVLSTTRRQFGYHEGASIEKLLRTLSKSSELRYHSLGLPWSMNMHRQAQELALHNEIGEIVVCRPFQDAFSSSLELLR